MKYNFAPYSAEFSEKWSTFFTNIYFKYDVQYAQNTSNVRKSEPHVSITTSHLYQSGVIYKQPLVQLLYPGTVSNF